MKNPVDGTKEGITSFGISGVLTPSLSISIPAIIQGILRQQAPLSGFGSSAVSLQPYQIYQQELLLASLQAMLAQKFVPIASTPMTHMTLGFSS